MAALFRERALRFVRGLTVAAWVRKQPRDQPYHLVSPIPVRVSGRNETCIPGASGRPFKRVHMHAYQALAEGPVWKRGNRYRF